MYTLPYFNYTSFFQLTLTLFFLKEILCSSWNTSQETKKEEMHDFVNRWCTTLCKSAKRYEQRDFYPLHKNNTKLSKWESWLCNLTIKFCCGKVGLKFLWLFLLSFNIIDYLETGSLLNNLWLLFVRQMLDGLCYCLLPMFVLDIFVNTQCVIANKL